MGEIRKIEPKVEISYGNEEIDGILDYKPGKSANSDASNDISNFYTLYNANHTPVVKAFTLEDNSENGLPADDEDAEGARGLINPEITGWWSKMFSKNENPIGSGMYPFEMSERPKLIVTFPDSRPIKMWQVYGDPVLMECPKRFQIELFEAETGGTAVFSQTYPDFTYCDIDSVKWTLYFNAEHDYPLDGDGEPRKIRRLEITILAWNKPNRLSKIYRCHDDMIETYGTDELKEFECTHEAVNNTGIKYGLCSDTCSVTLFNNKRKFDLGYLKTMTHLNKRVVPYVNGKRLGTYYIKEWNISQDDMFVQCKANDRLLVLQDIKYCGYMPEKDSSGAVIKESVYCLFKRVFGYVNTAVSEYVRKFDIAAIDIRLKDIAVEPYLPRKSVWDVLQILCDASLSFVYMNNRDEVVVTTEYFGRDVAGGGSGATINTSNAFSMNIPNFADMTANSVEIPYFVKNVKEGETLYTIKDVSAAQGQLLQFTVEFDDFCEIEKIEFDEETVDIFNKMKETHFIYKISFTPQETKTGDIKILGKKITFEKQGYSDSKDESIRRTALYLYTHPDCHLIQTKNRAKTIATAIFNNHEDGTKNVVAEWRGKETLLLRENFHLTDRFEREANYQCNYIKTTIQGGMKQEVKGILLRST